MREQQEISSLQNEESSSVDPSLTGSSVGQSEEGSARHERDTRLYTLRVAFVGNVDSGKSSLIGTLIKGELDDGRGSSRKAIFRHKHEIETGRTSSVATAYIGFDVNGNQIVSKRAGKSIPSAELASIAEKRIQLIDLAGHEKYLKTTVYGLTGMQPDIVIVVIGANMGVKRMTKEHLAIAVALEIPIIVALTKIDIAPKNVAMETMKVIRQSLRRYGKMAITVKTEEQAAKAAANLISGRIAPILPISNVTGDGLSNLKHFFSEISPCALIKRNLSLKSSGSSEKSEKANEHNKEMDINLNDNVELPVDETYQVPGVGFVIAGTLGQGEIKVNDTFLLGPDYYGHFQKVSIRSIECMYLPVKSISQGQTAAIAVRPVNKKQIINRSTFRKGMVLLSSNMCVDNYVSHTFEARVIILHHQTTVTLGYQPMINCRTIRQTAKIIAIEDLCQHSKPESFSGQLSEQDHEDVPAIRTGDRALVRFKFIHSPEFLRKGMRFVFRDGQAKGIGKVIRLIPMEKYNSNEHST